MEVSWVTLLLIAPIPVVVLGTGVYVLGRIGVALLHRVLH